MNNFDRRLNFDLGRKNEIITTTRKSIRKLIKLRSFVAKNSKKRKISNFLYVLVLRLTTVTVQAN